MAAVFAQRCAAEGVSCSCCGCTGPELRDGLCRVLQRKGEGGVAQDRLGHVVELQPVQHIPKAAILRRHCRAIRAKAVPVGGDHPPRRTHEPHGEEPLFRERVAAADGNGVKRQAGVIGQLDLRRWRLVEETADQPGREGPGLGLEGEEEEDGEAHEAKLGHCGFGRIPFSRESNCAKLTETAKVSAQVFDLFMVSSAIRTASGSISPWLRSCLLR